MRSLYPRSLLLLLSLVLLSSYTLRSQESISVDAISAMPVCSEKNPSSAGPCATAPRALSKINPSYPEKARQKRKEGTVTLGLIVSKDGSASGVHIVKGVDKEIDQAAIAAVSQWKFEPGTYQGNPVDVEVSVMVNFRLTTAPQQASSPENLKEQKEAADDLRNLYSDAAEAYKRDDYPTALNLYRKITSINPDYGSAWNDLGRTLLAMNQLDAAVDAFETSIKKDPSSRTAYNNLGLVYWRQRKYEEAAGQFRKQMVVNPDDHYAHRNLGMMLRDQHKCSDALPELQKGLSLTPNHAESMLAEGECDLDLGNRAKGISELEQATSVSSAPNIYNGAAYALARRNVEIDIAEKWSEKCLTIQNLRLQDVRLDQLSSEQLNYVFWMASYWDTRGWIYFLRGDTGKARSYVEAAWSLEAVPSAGDHLGQIYEKLGRAEDATRVYAMAVASGDEATRAKIDLDDLADAKKRLEKLAEGNIDARVKQGRIDLSEKSVASVANEGDASGSADFAVLLSAAGKTVEFRQLTGDKALGKLAGSLPAAGLPVSVPESSTIELPLRGTLTCYSGEKQCRFAFLGPEEAVNLARNESAPASAIPAIGTTHDPHIYENTAMGMRVSLPDQWKLVKEERGSFSHPHNAMFAKSGSLAMFMLTREHFEGSPELYQKMLDKFFSTKSEFKRAGEEAVKLDGLTGTRWNVSWNENGVPYSAVMEMFGVGDDYYRITTLAPNEIYDRYAETFENVLRSVRFPMLHMDPKLLDPVK